MVYIEAITIDDSILEKIEVKHGVLWSDVEDVCYSENIHVRRSKEGIYKVFGRTLAGRYLLVVLIDKGDGEWKVATARSMTDNEKRLFKQVVGGH
jgi:uncharacterized protein